MILVDLHWFGEFVENQQHLDLDEEVDYLDVQPIVLDMDV